ncbi:MAG TPA: molecular chaperone TorD family protein [bacterium]
MTNQLEVALGRGALYEALALGFRPPTEEMVTRLLNEQYNQDLSEIAEMVDEKVTASTALPALVRNWRACPDARDIETLASSYHYYFGHTAHSNIPLYETEYGEDTLFQQPQQLGDIAGFYGAFGLTVNLSEHERVDQVSCECEFMAFLGRKEAYAIELNDSVMVEETSKAQKLFLKDHLGRFIPSFTKLLMRESPKGFYGQLARFFYEFVAQDCARFSVSAGPEHLRLRPTELADDCFTCGGGEAVIRDSYETAPACEISKGSDKLINISTKKCIASNTNRD